MNTQINPELVKKVQQGTHCIDYLRHDNIDGLRAVIKECFPKEIPPTGNHQYYGKYLHLDTWDCYEKLPAGITPIPLHQFFEA